MQHEVQIIKGSLKNKSVYFSGAVLIFGSNKIKVSDLSIKAITPNEAMKISGIDSPPGLLKVFAEIKGAGLDEIAIVSVRAYQAMTIVRQDIIRQSYAPYGSGLQEVIRYQSEQKKTCCA